MRSRSSVSTRKLLATACTVLSFAILILACSASPATAQDFSTLHNFCVPSGCTDGYYPKTGLIQGTDGNYYGTTFFGGPTGAGSVFSITSDGTLSTFYAFCSQTNCADGSNPDSPLVLGSDGKFYGTTPAGGANGGGTIFSLTANGTLTVLYNFCSQTNCADGSNVSGALLQGSDGNFYGTTSGYQYPYGTVFRITPAGTFTTLHSFCTQTNCADGAYPFAALIQGSNGLLYGTTAGDGYISDGTVFSITMDGRLTTLYTFCAKGGICKDGSIPFGGLVQGNDGNFYGATEEGGDEYCSRGLNRKGAGCGTVFKITPNGRLTTLLSFAGPKAGENPTQPLLLATDGKLYGATSIGGTNKNTGCAGAGCGTIFSVTAEGALKTVHNFRGYGIDGYMSAGTVQGTDGNLYGATHFGGTVGYCEFGCGTVYRLSLGLPPFVKTIPASGTVGTGIIILGNNLTGASSVTFNGTPAAFTVVSNTEITATVPAGASSGEVEVVIPTGTLASNFAFAVTNEKAIKE